MRCGVSCRPNADPLLLWLGGGLGAKVQINPQAGKPPYAVGVGLKKKKKKKKKKFLKEEIALH